jgi:hypothetical protein
MDFDAFAADCGVLLTAWFKLDFVSVNDALQLLLRSASNMSSAKFRRHCENAEIFQTVTEIVDVTSDDNPPLRAFQERSQTIVESAFDLVQAFLEASSAFSGELLKALAETTLRNFSDYSPNAKIAAARFLVNIFTPGSPDAVLGFADRVVEVCREELEDEVDKDFVENLLLAVQNIARRSKLVDDLGGILGVVSTVCDRRLDRFIYLALCCLFYLVKENPSLLDEINVELILSLTAGDFEGDRENFYVLELLRLCYEFMSDDRLSELHECVNFDWVCGLCDGDFCVQFCVVKLVDFVLWRSCEFLDRVLTAGIFEKFAGFVEDFAFGAKPFVVHCFTRAFRGAVARQLRFMVEQGFHECLSEGLVSQQSGLLHKVLRAMLAIARESPADLLESGLLEELRENIDGTDEKTNELTGQLLCLLGIGETDGP